MCNFFYTLTILAVTFITGCIPELLFEKHDFYPTNTTTVYFQADFVDPQIMISCLDQPTLT